MVAMKQKNRRELKTSGGFCNIKDECMMIIELHHKNSEIELREIGRTELTAPLVLEDEGKFFIKAPCDPRICAAAPKHLIYKECRGESLNNIAIVRSAKSEEVLA